LQTFHTPKVLINGEHVCHCLTGMVAVAQAVNDGHGGVFCQFQYVVVGENTRHDAMHVTRQRTGNIGGAFALSKPNLVGTKHDGATAEMLHPNLEGYSCAE